MQPWDRPFIPDEIAAVQHKGELIGSAPKGLRISSVGGKVEASIDEFDLAKTCGSLSLEMGPGGRATLTAKLNVTKNDIHIEGAALKICGMEAGETVERAVLDHLMSKYDIWPMKGKCTIYVDAARGAARETAYQAGRVTSQSARVQFGPIIEPMFRMPGEPTKND